MHYRISSSVVLVGNGFGLYARWRFKALTLNIALMMIEEQMLIYYCTATGVKPVLQAGAVY
jgi:hypothetical protein